MKRQIERSFTLWVFTLIWGACEAATGAPTFGYLPASFPRDPLQFELFQEQMGIAQVLEPLVRVDRLGNIRPAIAESWKVEDGGRQISFALNPAKMFSQGIRVRPEDVKFSIERHRRSRSSQSRPLLENIASLKIENDQVVVKLKRAQHAFFRILSREQLGIVPNGWSYDPKAKEPFKGTGPYRLVRSDSTWHFVRNENFRGPNPARVSDWEIVTLPKPGAEITKLPDYIPMATTSEVAEWQERGLLRPTESSSREVLSFIQSSAWWNPRGNHYRNAKHRHLKMSVVRSLFDLRARKLNAERATGFIPRGVAGYIPNAIEFKPALPDSSIRAITLGIPDRLRKLLFDKDDLSKIENEYRIKIRLVSINSKTDRDRLHREPDIIINRWAGFFNDPEGFLPIIAEVARGELNTYFGRLWPTLLKASAEQVWGRRADAFRRLSEQMLREERYVPGWKTSILSVMSRSLTESKDTYRYTPRLTDIEFAQ